MASPSRLTTTARTAFLLAALAFIAPSTASAQKRPMTFTDLMAMHRISDPQPSPDGKWVLFSVTDADLAANKKVTHLWIVPADGKADSKPVTASLAGESRGRFSPDGKQVLFTSAMNGSPQIYSAPFDSATGNLGASHKLTSLATGSDGSAWSPDGSRILFVSEVYPDCPSTMPAQEECDHQRLDAEAASKTKAILFTALLYRHWNTYTGLRRSHLFVMDPDGSNIRDLTPTANIGDHQVPPFSMGGPDDYAWSPDSKEIAYVVNLDPVPAISTSKQVYTLALDAPDARPKKISTSAGGNVTPRYSPDGKWIAFRSQERAGYEADRFRLALYDRAAKKVSYPLPNFDRWVDDIVWTKLSHGLYFTAATEGSIALFFVDPSNPDPSVTQLEDGNPSLERGDLVAGPSDTILLYGTAMSVAAPSEVVRWNTEGVINRAYSGPLPQELRRWHHSSKQLESVTHLNSHLLAQLDLPPMESFWFHGALNTPVQGFILKPPNFDASKKYPVKFLIHGGPQGAWGDAWSYRWNPELFAANGYVVVMINPRGSTGYGQRFIDEINGDWGGKPFVDLMRGLDYAETKYPFIDKSRECALGASYGGYMANWILGHTHRFACIVSHDGMFDPIGAYGSTEELWFNEWEFRGTPWDYYGKPAARDPYRRWSPALAAKDFKTPTLVIHGQFDYRLDVSQGLELFTTLQRLNVPSEMLYFPDEGHWVLKPQNSQLWYKTVNAWCDKWTTDKWTTDKRTTANGTGN
jgi:dipeptidyl aminopeptidase/acylaminoacyl peptidase